MRKYFNELKRLDIAQKIIFFSLVIGLIILCIIKPLFLIIIGIISFIFLIVVFLQNAKFKNDVKGNGVIFGGRGKGKGLLLNKRINTDVNKKHFTNIPYNKHSMLINVKDYIDSILPNTTKDFIENNVKIIEKKKQYEGINIYWDDVGVYAPNFMDAQLKQLYPSLSALLPINRHLYNAYMIITVQDIQRPYKILRELQTDFAVKAVSTIGWNWFWNSLPFLRHISTTKYIFYENTLSAYNGRLPFDAKAIVNEALKHGLLTAGQATKEQYEAENGKIYYGRIWQLKKNIKYDTRYFHKVVYGVKAPTSSE